MGVDPNVSRRTFLTWYMAGLMTATLVAGIAPCVPGFLATVGVMETSEFWKEMYSYTWFISFAISFLVYLLPMKFLHTVEA